jgi:ABC-2 type transport system ATP-binding protein/lipopolysaccharide transport system ATP-binding protein
MSVPPVLNFGDFSVGLWVGTAQEDILDEPAATTFTLVGTGHDRPDRVLAMTLPFVVRPAARSA